MPPTFVLPETFVVFDTETSGMRPDDGHSIVELAAQKVQRRRVIGEFHALVNPGHALDSAAAEIHGISELELIAKGKQPPEVFPAFASFISSWPLVAHNVGFDIAFLNAHHQRLQLPLVQNTLIDSVAVARALLIIPSYSLQAVARYLKVPQPEAHRAMADVTTLREVLFKLADRAATKH